MFVFPSRASRFTIGRQARVPYFTRCLNRCSFAWQGWVGIGKVLRQIVIVCQQDLSLLTFGNHKK